MADETIRLRDLVHSLASTMVVTTKYLDQAAAELQNIYTTSPDGALAGLTPPRYTLDDMTVDLSFVIDDVRQSTEQPAQPTPLVELTENQATRLDSLLESLQADDLEAVADYEAELAQVQEAQRRFDADRARFDAQIEAEIRTNERRIAKLEAEIRRLGGNPFDTARLVRLRQQLEEALNLRQQLEQRRRQSPFHPSRRPRIDRPRPRGPRAGEPGYVEQWHEYLAAYDDRKDDYAAALALFEDEQPLGELAPPFTMRPILVSALQALEARSTFPKPKVDKIRDDMDQTDRAFAQLAELSAARAAGGVRVKIDPESIENAPPGALQSLHLRFRAQSQERVSVEGENVDIDR